jgi:hypothetical protein
LRWALALGRTPRELLTGVSSEDITEMIAFNQLEPFGALQEEFKAGAICAVIANVNRDPKRRANPYTAADFMPALRREIGRHAAAAAPAEPVLLPDAEAQSRLIKQALFGMRPDDEEPAA